MKIYHALLISILMASGPVFADSTDIDKGFEVHQYWCLPCHGDGDNFPGTMALKAKYKGAIAPVLAQRKELTSEMVTFFVRNGVNVMPFFRKTEISDKELTALGAYLSRNNKNGK